MRITRNIIAFIVLLAEAILITKFGLNSTSDRVVFMILGVIGAFMGTVWIDEECEYYVWAYPFFLIAALIIVPVVCFILLFGIGLAISLVKLLLAALETFGVDGTIGIGILIALAVAALGSVTFIFFF